MCGDAPCEKNKSQILKIAIRIPPVGSVVFPCHQKGYGLGKVFESWYSTGIPSTTPRETEAVIAMRHEIGRTV
jgi:hypothetical protein